MFALIPAAARLRAAWLAASLLFHGCGASPAPETPLAAVRAQPEPPRSWVCREIADRFLGLPSAVQDAPGAPAPLAGRWWVRGCELGLKAGAGRQSELTLHLD